MAKNKAFTLVELLIATAVVALLAAVLVPITAQAKQSAGTATTASNLRVIGLAAIQYSQDYDDRVVQTQWNKTDAKHWWAVSLSPYIPSRTTFFDPTRAVPTGTTVTVGGVALPWYQFTNLSINDAGYAGSWYTLGGTCAGRRSYYIYGRAASGISEPNRRVAFAPTTYAGTTLGTSVFHTFESNWINSALPVGTFAWNNVVYNTRTLYTGGSIPVVHADGSAGSLTRADFKDQVQAPNLTAYCAWMSTEGQRTWGPYWSAN